MPQKQATGQSRSGTSPRVTRLCLPVCLRNKQQSTVWLSQVREHLWNSRDHEAVLNRWLQFSSPNPDMWPLSHSWNGRQSKPNDISTPACPRSWVLEYTPSKCWYPQPVAPQSKCPHHHRLSELPEWKLHSFLTWIHSSRGSGFMASKMLEPSLSVWCLTNRSQCGLVPWPHGLKAWPSVCMVGGHFEKLWKSCVCTQISVSRNLWGHITKGRMHITKYEQQQKNKTKRYWVWTTNL